MYATPTVELWIETYADVPNRGLRWSSFGLDNPAAREFVYSERDMHRVMLTYGRLAAEVFLRDGPSEFRIRAYTIIGWLTRALYSWAWDVELDQYRPLTEPWVVWDEDAMRVSHGMPAKRESVAFQGT